MRLGDFGNAFTAAIIRFSSSVVVNNSPKITTKPQINGPNAALHVDGCGVAVPPSSATNVSVYRVHGVDGSFGDRSIIAS